MIVHRFFLGNILFAILFAGACKSIPIEQKEISGMEKVSEEEMSRRFLHHRKLMHDCFEKYMEYSSFQDSNSRVTSETVANFNSLFLDNANVYNDYLWKPKMVSAKVYADEVYIYHKLKGLKVDFEENVLNRFYSLKLESMSPTVDGTDISYNTFRYVFRAKKGMYSILNLDNEVLNYDEPIEYELDFVFYVSSKDNWAKIMDILPAEGKL